VNLIPSFSIKFDVLDCDRVAKVKKGGCPLNRNFNLRKKREGIQSGWKVECISNLEDYTGVVRTSPFDGDDNSNGLTATCKLWFPRVAVP
jgi:hypothetical protein